MKLRICCQDMKGLITDGWARGGEVFTYNSESREVTSCGWSLWLVGDKGGVITSLNYCPHCGDKVEIIRDIREESGNVMVGYSDYRYVLGVGGGIGIGDDGVIVEDDESETEGVYIAIIRYLDDESKTVIFAIDDLSKFREQAIKPYGLRWMGFSHIPFEVFKDGIQPAGWAAEYIREEGITSVAMNMFMYSENLHGELVNLEKR